MQYSWEHRPYLLLSLELYSYYLGYLFGTCFYWFFVEVQPTKRAFVFGMKMHLGFFFKSYQGDFLNPGYVDEGDYGLKFAWVLAYNNPHNPLHCQTTNACPPHYQYQLPYMLVIQPFSTILSNTCHIKKVNTNDLLNSVTTKVMIERHMSTIVQFCTSVAYFGIQKIKYLAIFANF